jgi:hypothetical protein
VPSECGEQCQDARDENPETSESGHGSRAVRFGRRHRGENTLDHVLCSGAPK